MIDLREKVDQLEVVAGRTFFVYPKTKPGFEEFNNTHETYLDGVAKVYTALEDALSVVSHYDQILVAPGWYAGDYVTPLNADAAFVKLKALSIGANGEPQLGTALTSATASEPALDVRARGWEICGLEFDNPTGAGGIRLSKSTSGGAQRGGDYVNIHHNLFTGGQSGIEFAGGGTYWKIKDNEFSLITTAGGAGIYVKSSGNQIPALGHIYHNRFNNNINHIDADGHGLSECTIESNNFQQDGVGQDATILFDLIGGSAGGNCVIDNYIDIPKAQFNTGGTQRVFSNATDYGAGNHFSDGAQDVTMRQ